MSNWTIPAVIIIVAVLAVSVFLVSGTFAQKNDSSPAPVVKTASCGAASCTGSGSCGCGAAACGATNGETCGCGGK